MLPMSLAPSRTGVVRAPTPLASVAPERSGQLAHLHWAAPLAVDYWQRVAGSALLRSAELRDLAAENARRVQVWGSVLDDAWVCSGKRAGGSTTLCSCGGL